MLATLVLALAERAVEPEARAEREVRVEALEVAPRVAQVARVERAPAVEAAGSPQPGIVTSPRMEPTQATAA